MVSGLQFKERDPEFPRKNRGRGWYYFRGNLTTGLVGGARTRNPSGQRGPTWSFYSKNKTSGSKMDAKKAHSPKRVRNVSKKLELQPHKGDYKTRNATSGNKVEAIPHRSSNQKYVRNRRTTRAGTGDKGFF